MDNIKLILGTMTFSDQADRFASQAMIEQFTSAGHSELDTAYAYNKGNTETLLGELIKQGPRDSLYIAGKVNPWNEHGLKPEEINRQLETSLSRLDTDFIDLLYLHAPDLDTPVEQTLEACFKLHSLGKFKDFGLSNFAAWQVAEIAEICSANGWMRPIVYQGMYNALTRDVESELFPCLRNYEIKFYAYNPLAGGLLTAKYSSFDQLPDQGRFATFDAYQDRYWKSDYFKVIEDFQSACAGAGISPAEAALRWLMHHSWLSSDYSDGIILGASRLEHLKDNLSVVNKGQLPSAIVDALEQGWQTVRPNCIKYYRP